MSLGVPSRISDKIYVSRKVASFRDPYVNSSSTSIFISRKEVEFRISRSVLQPGSDHDTMIFRDILEKYKEEFSHPSSGISLK